MAGKTDFTADEWMTMRKAMMGAAVLVSISDGGKADRTVDVRSYCSSIEHDPGLLRMELRMTDSGTARPDEIAQAVAGLAGRTATITRLVRTRIHLRPQPVGART